MPTGSSSTPKYMPLGPERERERPRQCLVDVLTSPRPSSRHKSNKSRYNSESKTPKRCVSCRTRSTSTPSLVATGNSGWSTCSSRHRAVAGRAACEDTLNLDATISLGASRSGRCRTRSDRMQRFGPTWCTWLRSMRALQ